MKNVGSWLVVSALGLSLSAAAAAPVSSVAAARRQFVDVTSYITSEAQYEAWLNLRIHLKQNFDDICGDTFCEGDYSNIQSLRFQCSVDQKGTLGQCVWVFAASNEEINVSTGAITVQTQTWSCVSPLAPNTKLSALLTALSGPQPLYATLPGTTTSLYDGLGNCL